MPNHKLLHIPVSAALLLLFTPLAHGQMIEANIGTSVGPENTYNFQNPGSAYVSPYSTYPTQGASAAAYGSSARLQSSARRSNSSAGRSRIGTGNYIRSNYYGGQGYGGGYRHYSGYMNNSGYRNNMSGYTTYSPSFPTGYYNNYSYSSPAYGY